jgi:hypothetical protein
MTMTLFLFSISRFSRLLVKYTKKRILLCGFLGIAEQRYQLQVKSTISSERLCLKMAHLNHDLQTNLPLCIEDNYDVNFGATVNLPVSNSILYFNYDVKVKGTVSLLNLFRYLFIFYILFSIDSFLKM